MTIQDKILIVDDNPTNLNILFSVLDQAGYEVIVAENGKSALVRVKNNKPNLILLDILMPVLDGFETCQRLKAQPETKDIPVIFITALSDTPSKIKGFKLGAVDYITKPFQRKEVLARVETHLTIQRLQKDLRTQNQQLQIEIKRRDEVERELQQQTRELALRNEESRAFSSTVAHDLKSPLAAVASMIELIQDDPNIQFSQKHQKFLTSIADTAHKMMHITDELLLLARIRNSEMLLKPLDMSEIIHLSLFRIDYLVERHQAHIKLADAWPVALGHGSWIEQVWINLISNAIKYGGRPPRLELGAEQDNTEARFWIRDNGQGLTPEEQAQLFAEFSQLNKNSIRGHGLGLSIVRRIIEKMGGQTGVESQPGQGSTFYFTLKIAADVPENAAASSALSA